MSPPLPHPEQKPFFITGATGQQGGHTALALLHSGHAVHALIRDPTSLAAKAIEKQGAVLFKGDFASPVALAAAANGCHGAFLNVCPVFTDPDGELKHAQNVIAASRGAGVQKIVYSSAVRVSDYPDLKGDGRLKAGSGLGGYFSSKWRIEELVKEAGFESWTILQPAWLMSNLRAPSAAFYFPELKSERVLKTAYEAETRLQVLDPKDVGVFAKEALTCGIGRWNGRVVPLAGEEITIGGIADAINSWIGRSGRGKGKGKVRAEFMVGEEREKMKVLNPMVPAQIWIMENGSGVDLDKVRGYGVQMGTLEEFLERETAAMNQALEG